MFHLHPDHEANIWSRVKAHLTQVQERLRNGNPNTALEGFLIGAKPTKSVNWPNITPSRTSWQARNLFNFFKDSGVDFTALLIQKEETKSHLHYSLPNNEVTLWIEGPKMFQRKITKLEEIFSRIRTSSNDKRIFRGED